MRAALLGEVLGTFLMVLIGTGSVACAVLTGALQGLWQVAVVWGLGVAIAIYTSAALSGPHLNPAVTAAFALLRPDRFPSSPGLPSMPAPLPGAGGTRARDSGRRLGAVAAGYGAIAIPGPEGGFWAYVVGPMIGGPLGGLLYERCLRPQLARRVPAGSERADSRDGGPT